MLLKRLRSITWGVGHVFDVPVDSPTVAHVAPRLRFLPPAPLRFLGNFRVEFIIRRNASRRATSPTLNRVHSTGLALPAGLPQLQAFAWMRLEWSTNINLWASANACWRPPTFWRT